MTSRLSLFLLLCVISGTLFFLFASIPEAYTFSLADGELTVITLASEGAWLEGEKQDEVYTLRSSLPSSQEAELRMKSDTATDRLAYFDEAFGMWRPVATEYDAATSELTTTTTKFNTRWTGVAAESVARPNFDEEKEALIAVAPIGAVSFAIEIGFADSFGDYVELHGLGQTGGCGGQYRYTGKTTLTSSEVIFSDALRYQIVVVWQLADGCAGRDVIE